ncbi:hypothetical protein OAO01_02095 [Oligoflexia bacterium]|nr:hypothetical protein [Oligoflexia bacterium]
MTNRDEIEQRQDPNPEQKGAAGRVIQGSFGSPSEKDTVLEEAVAPRALTVVGAGDRAISPKLLEQGEQALEFLAERDFRDAHLLQHSINSLNNAIRLANDGSIHGSRSHLNMAFFTLSLARQIGELALVQAIELSEDEGEQHRPLLEGRRALSETLDVMTDTFDDVLRFVIGSEPDLTLARVELEGGILSAVAAAKRYNDAA